MQKKKGISLIVLVITIIVMIILAAAIIISLNNSGIIGKANKAVKDTNEQEVNHIAELAWSEAYLNGARTEEELTEEVKQGLINAGLNPNDYGMIVTTKGVKISKGWLQDRFIITKGDVTLEAGDLIQYDDGVNDYSGAWKVLGAEEGNLLIMSTEDVGKVNLVGISGGSFTYYDRTIYSNVTITSQYGLLNVTKRLNEICSLYKRGTGTVGARSIKVEDVDKLTGYDKTTYEVNLLNQYGNEVTYSWNSQEAGKVDYTSTNGENGTLFNSHIDGFSYLNFDTMTKTTVAVNAGEMPILTSTVYEYSISDETIETNSTNAIDMIFGIRNTYLLASYYVCPRTSFVEYGMKVISDPYSVRNLRLYLSLNNEFGVEEIGVRAVVELSPNIIIGEKDNTLGWSYTI